jgi:solute carrier family 25 citrate transporter 1
MSKEQKKSKNLGIHLISGGMAGLCEALACHPLDTIKVRLQLRGEKHVRTKTIAKMASEEAVKSVKPKSQNFISVGSSIVRQEGFLSLYKGLGAVVTGIVPKMAIRFSSFEYFKSKLTDKDGVTSSPSVFLGLI